MYEVVGEVLAPSYFSVNATSGEISTRISLLIDNTHPAFTLDHIMDFTPLCALTSLFSMLNQGARDFLA